MAKYMYMGPLSPPHSGIERPPTFKCLATLLQYQPPSYRGACIYACTVSAKETIIVV